MLRPLSRKVEMAALGRHSQDEHGRGLMCKIALQSSSVQLAVLALALLDTSCATGQRGFPARDGIANFDRVDEQVYRGAEINNLGIAHLHHLGIGTVIDLRREREKSPTEEFATKENAMCYVPKPMSGIGRPDAHQVKEILDTIGKSRRPVYVHCKYGCDRTGTIIACYRIQRHHWTAEAALREAAVYGMSWSEYSMRQFVRDFARAQVSK
jgi:protein tyrosine phosphatase (PTP) superfamily phosphohydrolase (DUF442 family)